MTNSACTRWWPTDGGRPSVPGGLPVPLSAGVPATAVRSVVATAADATGILGGRPTAIIRPDG